MNKESYSVIVRESLNAIREAYISKCLSVFVGAGVSKDSGMPSWGELMGKIRKTIASTDDREDYLKTAEKFYIQFKALYYKKLSEFISNDNKEANEIHKKIIELDVRNIITTNWDNLLEKAIDTSKSKKDTFDIISQDSDLNNMTGKYHRLIKMHGELDKRNIVFTETDYLEYSRNFPLIENYVKAVFSTDIIVLIGYSLNDPNVKQILSWLKRSGNSMPIYLVRTEETKEEKEAKGFDLADFHYYDKKGVKLLYLSEIYEEKTHKEQLIKFFEYISATIKGFKLSNDEIDSSYHMLMRFDLKAMEGIIKEKIKDSREEKDILLKSFLLYYTYQEFESYDALKELSEIAYKNGAYDIWYISVLNKQHFTFHLGGDIENHDERQEKINAYLEDARKIALEDTYQQLPQNVRNNLRPLTILENDLYKRNIETYKLLNAIRNDFDIYKNGGFSFNDNVQKILDIFQEVRNEMMGLCLLHRGYDELYVNIMECLLIAKGLDFLRTDKSKKAAERNNRKVDERECSVTIELEIFSHSIRYFKTKDLQEIMGQYLQNRYFVFEKQEEIGEIFTNICGLFNHFGAFTSHYSRWFNNFLIMSAHIQLDQVIFDSIIEAFCEKMSDGVISFNEYEYLEYFIVKQYHANTINIDVNALSFILQEYMRKISSGKFRGYDILLQTNSSIFKNIFAIFQNKQYKLAKENKKIIIDFIESIPLRGMRDTFLDFIVGIFHIADEALQASIKAALKEKICSADAKERELAQELCRQLVELGILSEEDCECLVDKNK